MSWRDWQSLRWLLSGLRKRVGKKPADTTFVIQPFQNPSMKTLLVKIVVLFAALGIQGCGPLRFTA